MPDSAPVRLSLALSVPVPSPEGAWEILATAEHPPERSVDTPLKKAPGGVAENV